MKDGLPVVGESVVGSSVGFSVGVGVGVRVGIGVGNEDGKTVGLGDGEVVRFSLGVRVEAAATGVDVLSGATGIKVRDASLRDTVLIGARGWALVGEFVGGTGAMVRSSVAGTSVTVVICAAVGTRSDCMPDLMADSVTDGHLSTKLGDWQ